MGLFGTDGIRGVYGSGFFTRENIYQLGIAAGLVLKKYSFKKFKPKVLIGKDTRYSSDIIEKKLSDGLITAGLAVDIAGTIPTPAISYLASQKRYLAGIVISASHNPWQDNGIKFFSETGEKLSEKIESEIEKLFLARQQRGAIKTGCSLKQLIDYRKDLTNEYIEFLLKSIDCTFEKLRIVIDCANGSTSYVAPRIFERLKASSIFLNIKPSGKNINKNCGSLHPEIIQRAVKKYRAHCGISFDGDGDRVIFCDEKGNFINGDQIIGAYAIYLKSKKELSENLVVVTAMTNYGFYKVMEKEKINVITTPVGDKYVWEAMKNSGAAIGGEQSGHIIFSKYLKTGDGLLTALKVLSAMKEKNQKLSEFAGFIKMYPQVLINLPVAQKIPLEKMPAFSKLLKEEEEKISGEGRIFIRYSGTEPLLRIMVEGASRTKINKVANRLKTAFLQEING